MNYETIIGLEVHAQLRTRSKMYCRCSADYASAPPNTHVCPVCLGMPGVLPTINQQAIEYTIMTALALNCAISEYTKFDRKNYPYPDLMKGYQISQYDAPIGHHGWLTIETDGQKKQVGITRVHLEEDVAKLLHRTPADGEAYSLVDVNRSGVPLMEIVGEPDLRSPEEARHYLIKLHSLLQYLDVSTANMEEGSFRCDANISIRPEGKPESLAKVEVKNMNSFRAVYRALEYEARRQRKAAEEGKKLVQETRGWLEEKGVTIAQRSKEYAHDYRYFPEPDLPPLVLNREWVEAMRSKLPELPEARRNRFVAEYDLSLYDANLLTSSRAMADYFEACLRKKSYRLSAAKSAKMVANWLLGESSRLLNVTNTEINDSKISPGQLCQLLDLIEAGSISATSAKQVFAEMFSTGKDATDIMTQKGLSQISDTHEVADTVSRVIIANPQPVADYKAGKEQALKFLVGQVMKATGGRADPKLVNELLKKKVEEE
ncbi:MAG: Asp-tRNA(Asn)/Glu-tRNA(Gln) amidotransferase subunit GatB [Chloroflexi bacterium]|nr:Asp-tRNA(Asn)/Glu-tRNA(Gln) amidotransferase subunit GatB [Chloroflexota bacterium]MBI3931594.1 Asp-tRNA(Asn)/Glu-tRNA(Gln) amidotransferase subunit GatB [Chloroflexota bacterium]